MEVGTKIKRIRELKNIPMKEIAEKLDMSIQGYSKIERNEVSLTVEKLMKIAEAMELKPEELLTFDDKIVFKNSILNSCAFVNHGHLHNHTFPEELHQLYKDKVQLLEDTITMLRAEIERLKGK